MYINEAVGTGRQGYLRHSLDNRYQRTNKPWENRETAEMLERKGTPLHTSS